MVFGLWGAPVALLVFSIGGVFSPCLPLVQIVLRTFNLPYGRSNAFGVQGGCSPGWLAVTPFIAFGVQIVLRTFKLSFGRSRGKISCLPTRYTVIVAFGVQGVGALLVKPLYRYTGRSKAVLLAA